MLITRCNFGVLKLLAIAVAFSSSFITSCSKTTGDRTSSTSPSITLTSPTVNDAFTAPADILITANAADADGSITKVIFLSEAGQIAEDNTPPYSYTWSGVAAGTYQISARATDNSGNNTISEKITVTVSAAATDNRTPVEKYGQLKVNGVFIAEQNNKAVQLRGMSFFWSQWMGQYYNLETVKWLKNDWRSTAVRAAMGVEEGGYLTNATAEKAKVMAVVDAAIAEGLYVIIDWHDHNAQNHVAEAKAFFTEMATKYGNKPNVLYEIYNEPVNVTWSGVIKPYATTIIQAIRAVDPDNIIIVGTPNWSQDVDVAANDPLPFTNIAYTLHYYAATHKQALRNKATTAINKGLALMVTEFGTSEASGAGYLDETETRTWWNFLDQNKISWLNWSVADKSETSAALMPGANGKGGWSESAISPSGKIIRNELRLKNP